MAEEDDLDESLTAGLSVDDIKPRIYEGGFKTWECSVDLARYLLRAAEEGRIDLLSEELRVIEVPHPTDH